MENIIKELKIHISTLGEKLPNNFSKPMYWNTRNILHIYYYLTSNFKNIHEGIYKSINNISEPILCDNIECSNELKITNFRRIPVCCCNACLGKSEKIKLLRIQSFRAKYGVDNPSQIETVQELKKTNCLERYGVESSNQREDVKLKIANTNLERYGNICSLQCEENRLKTKATWLNNFGVDNPWKSKSIQQKLIKKAIETKLKNFKLRKFENDYAGTVYVILFEELNLVKIGVSSNIKNRFRILAKDFGNFKTMFLYNVNKIFFLENFLQTKFKKQNVHLKYGCGRTEFFQSSILNDKIFSEIDKSPASFHPLEVNTL